MDSFAHFALAADPIVFVSVFAVLLGVLALMRPKHATGSGKPTTFRLTRSANANRSTTPKVGPAQSRQHNANSSWKVGDAASQLRIIMSADFEKRCVVSKAEAQVMKAAENEITLLGKPWRVMAQASLGEVLWSENKAAYASINAKRVDLLIMAEDRQPLAAIEYQGEGHWQGTAPARDAVKKEALRKAGIRYIEITHEHGPEDVAREIRRLATLDREPARSH